LDPTFRLCSGQENLANACLRRLNCEEGCLAEIGGDPNYGYNVRGNLNSESRDPGALGEIKAAVRSEVLKDLRVLGASPEVIAAVGQTIMIPITLMTAQGPFDFVAVVGDMSVDFLKQGLPAGIPTLQSDVVGRTITVVTEIGSAGPVAEASAAGSSGPDLDGLYATDSGSEDLLKEALADFSSLATASLSLTFSALVQSLSGATGTFRLRLGGTDGLADGTLLATVSSASASYIVVRTTATLTNPGGQQVLKLTGQSSSIGATILVKSVVANFVAA
jgi:hypothetical protein